MISKVLLRVREQHVHILLLIAVPVLLGLRNPGWLYTPIGYLDPWYNVGYFLHYGDPNFLPGHYKESRLSWIAPGYALYSLLGPTAANFVLHVGALTSSAVFVYLTLARLVSRKSGLIVAALLTAYYPFHGSGGWDYQTTPSGAYYALTLYLLTRASQSARPINWLVATGMAFGATFHANIIFVNMVPVLAAQYLAVGRQHRNLKGIIQAASWSLLGFVLVTLVLCLIAWSVGRRAAFFWPIVEIVFNYTRDPSNMKAWWSPWSSLWFLRPEAFVYLILPASILVASVIWLMGLMKGRSANLRPDTLVPVALVAQYVFLALLWIVWQSFGHVALQPDYFAYPLIIPAFIALGVLIQPVDKRLLVSTCVAMIVAFIILQISPDLRNFGSWITPNAFAIMTGVVMLAAVVGGVLLPATKWMAVPVAAFVYLVAYPPLAIQTGVVRRVLWSELGSKVASRTCVDAESAYAGIVRLIRLFRLGNPVWWQTWVWIGPDEEAQVGDCRLRLVKFRGSLISTGTGGLGTSNDRSADDISDQYVGFVTNGGQVVAIVRDPLYLDQLIARFARFGKRLEVIHREEMNFGAIPVILVIYRSSGV
ncbi:hypothetical protein [Microvirga brassicacearum]|uniref:Glycosyltransferase RgtA/B/C/D-like domain-containing protein n=1 Tax=Microvirga brassicacearum TaxID=2580413 RepID=A0A5N3PIZ5_9HYPH|nr:hypothetical protein [Microvirga brassicacearum]KAB0269710.1 hypothetical protein FEZ63_00105 [Microvirga brassicacearum]